MLVQVLSYGTNTPYLVSYATDSRFDTDNSLSRGNLTYKYAALSHLPRVLIRESSMPTEAAVVAAPIQKLYPAYLDASTPDDCKAALHVAHQAHP